MNTRFNWKSVVVLAGLIGSAPMSGQSTCADLPSHAALTAALKSSIAPTGGPSNGGFDFHAWAVVVTRDGEICAVTKSGTNRGDQFPVSRLAAAQKANAANANSLDGLAISTANLHSIVQPGGALFGFHPANPPDARVAYGGTGGARTAGAPLYGTPRDPLVGKILGGIITFGGGLALYNSESKVIGGLGIGGDSACADHNIAWRVRAAVGLDNVPFGLHPVNANDGIIYDVDADGASSSGFGHPFCGFGEPQVATEIGAGSVPAMP